MVHDRALVTAGDHDDLIDSGGNRLFDPVLDDQLVHHRQHLFRLRLGCGQEARASPAAGNTALRIAVTDLLYFFFFFARSRRDSWIRLTPALSTTIFGGLALRSRARMRAASRGDNPSSIVMFAIRPRSAGDPRRCAHTCSQA